jgi:hypothetical protein
VPDLLLRDIQINARQEAARMRHHFIGVEHLIAGALMLRGGIIASLMETYGYKPEYVIDAIRRHVGKGSNQRLWGGMPNSPRAEIVMGIANDLALEDGRGEISERDLLRAMIEEGDSIPARILQRLGIDLDLLSQDVLSFSSTAAIPLPYVKVEFAAKYDTEQNIPEEQLFILRRMFYGYARVRVERRLMGGYSRALLLAVTPIQQDGSEDAMVVVKIDDANIILEEARRFEQQVKTTLPPLTARLEERPTAPETSDLAGLKYTFVSPLGKAEDMREGAWRMGLAQFGAWLRSDLYPTFGRAWWDQRRPYRFPAWQEYDYLLPPLFTLDVLPDGARAPESAILLRDPIRRERLREAELGDTLVLVGFSIARIDRERNSIQLTIGSGIEGARRAHRVEIRGIDLRQNTHYLGEMIDQISGRIYATRSELLLGMIRNLTPDFDPTAPTLPALPPHERLPNPLHHYDALLDATVYGSLSRIHGDLHLGNILMGPNSTGFLIDFAQARVGHTLFDWATMEISLLNDLVMKTVGESWADARRVIQRLAAFDGSLAHAPDPALDDALSPLESLREIILLTLSNPNDWSEYWVALTFCALRAVHWETMPLGSRRLMLLLAAYACHQITHAPSSPLDSSMTAEDGLSDASGSGRSGSPLPPS